MRVHRGKTEDQRDAATGRRAGLRRPPVPELSNGSVHGIGWSDRARRDRRQEQLLSLLLIGCYRRPLPILLGIAAATLVNHVLAGLLGGLLAQRLPADVLRWLIGLGFLAMAMWALRPDRLDGDTFSDRRDTTLGIFGMTAMASSSRKSATRRSSQRWPWPHVSRMR